MAKIGSLFVFIILAQIAQGQLTINEASNANQSTLVLPDGSRPDWIELFANDAINLEGYSLSDDRDALSKWTFIGGAMLSGEFLTVLATGQSNFNTINHWETAIYPADTWKYIVPVADLPSNWNTLDYSTIGWTDASLGIGYGDGDDVTTLASPLNSVYVRRIINVSEPTAIVAALLDVDFDDGFVAYLNGVEIARSGLVGLPPAWNEGAFDHEAAIYLGGAPTSFSIDPELLHAVLVPGANVLAIQVHNSFPESSDLSLIPFLTFGFNNDELYYGGTTHPYFIPYVESAFLSTNFGLSPMGETVYLSDPLGNIIDSLEIPDLDPDMSAGKFLDGTSSFKLFTTPTIGSSNNTAIAYTTFENAPKINVSGGQYPTAINVTIQNNSETGGIIYYTLNGEMPTEAAAIYSGPILISSTTVLKAVCISSDETYLPSRVDTESFLIMEDFTIPVISISTAPENLYGFDGIFDNWWTDWRKPCVIEYFDADGTKQFESRASMKPDGGAGGSRSNPQHSVTIEPGNNLLGEGQPVNYPLIPAKSFINEYHAFYLRNGSNFWNAYPQKDATYMRITQETHANSQAYSPAIVFVNGEYFGVYEIREKANENYFESNYGNHPDSLDLLSVSYFYGPGDLRTVKGSNESFYEMRDFVTSYGPLTDDFLTLSDEKIDLDNFADYIAAENWIGNIDWIYNNIKIARLQSADNRWKFFLQDVELGLGGWVDYTVNIFDYFRYENLPNPYWDIYEALIQNPTYRNYFVNRYADLMNTIYQPANFMPIINEMYAELLPEMPRHFEKWTGDVPGGMDTYDYYRNVLEFQFSNRNGIVREQIVNEFELEKQVNVTLNVYPAGSGYIKISTIVPTSLPWTGVYFDGVPVNLTAVANPGYTFIGWAENLVLTEEMLTQQEVELNIPSNAVFKALFSGSTQPISLAISELHYHPDSTLNGGNWIELHNYGSTQLELTNWSIKSKNYWDKYVFPAGIEIPSNGYLVVCEDTTLFKAEYPEVTNFIGSTKFDWSNKNDSITLFDAHNEMVLFLKYNDKLPYPECADGWGRSMENQYSNQTNSNGESWFCGCIGGSPGRAYAPCQELLTITEINYNDDVTSYNSGDWFEIRNNSDSPINVNGYKFKDAAADHTYILPDVTIPAYGYWVFSNDLFFFDQQHPSVTNVSGGFDFGLGKSDAIRLYASEGALVNSLLYRNDGDWPVDPSVSNYTLEAIDHENYFDPNLASSWFVGCEGGSPGKPYSVCFVILPGLEIGLYPNPTTGLINVAYDNSNNPSGNCALSILDMEGRTIYFNTISSEDNKVVTTIDMAHYASGTYIARIILDNIEYQALFVKI